MRLRIVFLFLALALLSSCRAKAPQYPAEPPPVSQDKQNKGENLFLEAEAYYQQRDYRLARQAYAAYVQQRPEGPRAHQARLREAELLGLLGDWSGSLGKYEDILKRGAEGEAAYQARYGIGRAYFKLGRYQSAAGVLESLTASQLPGPLRFATNALLAEIALKNGEVEPAFLRLRLASRDLGAGDQEWFEHLKTRLVEQANPTELEFLANLYRDSALTAPLLLRLARLAQEEGRTDEARRWLHVLKERFPDSKEAQTADKSGKPSRAMVGCLLPLSAANADYGNRVKQGMELAVQGTNLELIYRDTAKDPAQTARLVQELAQDSRLAALLGPLTSAEAQAAAEAAQAAGLPLISLSQKRDLTGAGPLIFRIFLTPTVQMRALLRHALEEKGLKRYAMLTPDTAYGRTLAQVFGDELLAQGGVLVSQATYPPDTKDFTQILTSLFPDSQAPPGTEASPAFEALFVPDEAGLVAAIATQAAQRPSGKVQLLGTNLAKPRKNQAGLSQTLDGIMFTDAFFSGDPNPAVQNFMAAYRQRYGTEPDHLAAQGFLVVRLMAHVLEGPNPPSRAELPNKLLTLGNISDIPWFKGFASDRQAELTLYLLTIRNGQVEMVSSQAAGQP